jgi:hypothetical protein
VINHYVVRLHISVHYPFAVAEIQRLKVLISTIPIALLQYANLQQLEYVVSNIVVDEFGIKAAEVSVVDVFGNKAGRFTL